MSVAVANEQQAVSIERFKWVGELPKKKNIIVKNYYGDISTQTISKPIVHIQSVYQKIGSQTQDPEFRIEETSKGLEVEVVYPKMLSNTRDKGTSIRADLGLYIPEGYHLSLETTFGNIKAKKHQSHIMAKSESGNIKVATSGEVQVISESGNIFYGPRATRWKNDQSIFTRDGNVTLLLPKLIELEVSILAAKGVSSNLKRHGLKFISQNSRTLFAKLGGANSKLRAESINGKAEVIYDRKTDEDFRVSHRR